MGLGSSGSGSAQQRCLLPAAPGGFPGAIQDTGDECGDPGGWRQRGEPGGSALVPALCRKVSSRAGEPACSRAAEHSILLTWCSALLENVAPSGPFGQGS